MCHAWKKASFNERGLTVLLPGFFPSSSESSSGDSWPYDPVSDHVLTGPSSFISYNYFKLKLHPSQMELFAISKKLYVMYFLLLLSFRTKRAWHILIPPSLSFKKKKITALVKLPLTTTLPPLALQPSGNFLGLP